MNTKLPRLQSRKAIVRDLNLLREKIRFVQEENHGSVSKPLRLANLVEEL
jgi:hypothetical protein